MNLHKHQLYLLKQHSESFKMWSAIIRINTEGKSLIMKLGACLLKACDTRVLKRAKMLNCMFCTVNNDHH